MHKRTLILLALLAIPFPALLLNAQEKEDEQEQTQDEVVERSKNTSLIILKKDVSPERKEEVYYALKGEAFADQRDPKEIEWFVVRMSPEEARKLKEQYPDAISDVEENSIVRVFAAGCGTPTSIQSPAETPQGVTIVGGPLQSVSSTRRVFVVDSGVDVATNYLTISYGDSAKCNNGGCMTANGFPTRVEDSDGHGTFVAGIIAGKEYSGSGLRGMAPGAPVVPIKVFNNHSVSGNRDRFQHAIDWVFDKAQDGDVVNLSWGWAVDRTPDGSSFASLSYLEQKIRMMADNGVKIAISAGNFDPNDPEIFKTGGFVELLAPARSGGYRPAGHGAVVTVSGMNNAGEFWLESFNKGSFFGNGARPDFASPGVDVHSLWLGNQRNICTGTSFSAAHISGALLQAPGVILETDSVVVSDPDVEQDKIATCQAISGNPCIVQ